VARSTSGFTFDDPSTTADGPIVEAGDGMTAV
jgi:hypothetical protein